jgi:hypothetical protein
VLTTVVLPSTYAGTRCQARAERPQRTPQQPAPPRPASWARAHPRHRGCDTTSTRSSAARPAAHSPARQPPSPRTEARRLGNRDQPAPTRRSSATSLATGPGGLPTSTGSTTGCAMTTSASGLGALRIAAPAPWGEGERSRSIDVGRRPHGRGLGAGLSPGTSTGPGESSQGPTAPRPPDDRTPAPALQDRPETARVVMRGTIHRARCAESQLPRGPAGETGCPSRAPRRPPGARVRRLPAFGYAVSKLLYPLCRQVWRHRPAPRVLILVAATHALTRDADVNSFRVGRSGTSQGDASDSGSNDLAASAASTSSTSFRTNPRTRTRPRFAQDGFRPPVVAARLPVAPQRLDRGHPDKPHSHTSPPKVVARHPPDRETFR